MEAEPPSGEDNAVKDLIRMFSPDKPAERDKTPPLRKRTPPLIPQKPMHLKDPIRIAMVTEERHKSNSVGGIPGSYSSSLGAPFSPRTSGFSQFSFGPLLDGPRVDERDVDDPERVARIRSRGNTVDSRSSVFGHTPVAMLLGDDATQCDVTPSRADTPDDYGEEEVEYDEILTAEERRNVWEGDRALSTDSQIYTCPRPPGPRTPPRRREYSDYRDKAKGSSSSSEKYEEIVEGPKTREISLPKRSNANTQSERHRRSFRMVMCCVAEKSRKRQGTIEQ